MCYLYICSPAFFPQQNSKRSFDLNIILDLRILQCSFFDDVILSSDLFYHVLSETKKYETFEI
jgi:hypothetical protein